MNCNSEVTSNESSEMGFEKSLELSQGAQQTKFTFPC